MLTNEAIVDNDEVSVLKATPERRQWSRRFAMAARARLAWRTSGLRVSKTRARLIDISEGGMRVFTETPAPVGLSYIWVGLESLPGEWVKGTVREIARNDRGWVYHVGFLEHCAPGIIEHACMYRI